MTIQKLMVLLLVIFATALAVTTVTAAPQLINVQGILCEPGGSPIADGNYDVTFTIYDSETGGAVLWQETGVALNAIGGQFNYLLGSKIPLAAGVFSGDERWLGIKVGSDSEMIPRSRLTSVAYALNAIKADTARVALSSGGAGAWIEDGTSVYLVDAKVGIGTSQPGGKLEVVADANYFDGMEIMNNSSGDSSGARILIRSGSQVPFSLGRLGPNTDQRDGYGAHGESFIYNGAEGKALNIIAPDPSAGSIKFFVGTNARFAPKVHIQRSGTVAIATSAVPLQFTETDQTGQGRLWRMPLDAKHIRFDVSDNGEDFSSYTTILDLKPSGEVVVPVLRITGGADLAEPFDVTNGDDIKPGMVLVIDKTNPGNLRLSNEPYDKRVAGIVSGAGDIKTGLTLRQEGVMAGGHNVALTGRVLAFATDSNGAIAPGDMLTTSEIPGHLMKATDPFRSHGAIAGKAMSALDIGTGLVLVLVNLQ